MGREAICNCNWSGTDAQVKALIEPPELILRGGIRRRMPLAELKNVRAEGELLRFEFDRQCVSISLGSPLAATWAAAITTPPPSLAKKLGITSETHVRMLGSVDDGALHDALDTASRVSNSTGDLIIARADTPEDIARSLKAAASDLASGTPIWFVYPKGRGHAMSEHDVRAMGLAAGLVDTKVAAVSPRLTALRFVRRRNSKSA
jgi:hypothetical protein